MSDAFATLFGLWVKDMLDRVSSFAQIIMYSFCYRFTGGFFCVRNHRPTSCSVKGNVPLILQFQDIMDIYHFWSTIAHFFNVKCMTA